MILVDLQFMNRWIVNDRRVHYYSFGMAYSTIRPSPLQNKENRHQTPQFSRKVCKTVFGGPVVSGFQEGTIAEQLQAEIKSVKVVLRECAENRSNWGKKGKTEARELIEMERELRKKKDEIEKMNIEIGELKENKRVDRQTGGDRFKLATELAVQKNEVASKLGTFKAQMTKYQLLCEAVSKLEEKWHEVHPNHTMNYQIYRQNRKQNHEYDTIRESRSIYNTKDSLNTTPNPNSSLQQLQVKKSKLATALAASRKKHKAVLRELSEKLQFLRDQDDLASKDIESVLTQKEEMEDKVRSRFGYRTRKCQKSTIVPARPQYFNM